MQSLEQIRPHLRLYDEGDPAQDLLIQGYIESAADYIGRYLRIDIDAVYGAQIPAGILQAHRLLVAHYFHTRESTGAGADAPVAFGVTELLADFRNMS